MTKVVAFLNEKAAKGDFVFSDSLATWEANEDVTAPLGMSYKADRYYYAIALAHIATKNNGKIEIPKDANIWQLALSLTLLAEIASWKPLLFLAAIRAFEDKTDDIAYLLSEAAQVYAQQHFERGQELKESLQEYETSICAGLMDNDFERYCKEYPPAQNEELFTEAFCQTRSLDEKAAETAFNIATTFPYFESTAAMAFLMKEQRLLHGERKLECEDRILALLKEGNTAQYVTPFCNWVIRNEGERRFDEDAALLLIGGLGVDNHGLLKTIDNAVVLRDKEPEWLVKVLLKVAEVFSPSRILDMRRCLHRLNENQNLFIELVVLLVIHNNGEYRSIGRRLWDDYHLETSNFDAASLPETAQCAFAYSMLQDRGNPETRLPKVLPLVKSKHKQVKNFVIALLRPYTDDYMGHVVAALEKLKMKGKEAKMIKSYVDGRWRVIKERREMKELSPVYTYGRVYKEAQRAETEHLQSQMKEAEEKHHTAWKEFATTVMLARGGGWRNADGSTQKLSLIQFSMPARQLTQSLSPREQNDWISELLKDWNDTEGNN